MSVLEDGSTDLWGGEAEVLVDINNLIGTLGDDPCREGLRETPRRYLNALKFMCQGYGADPGEVMKTFVDGSENYDELVFQANIPFFSLCEHHILPFFGFIHIGYIPHGRVLGLSKLARVAEIFARRLQVQERLTAQIADALMDGLSPRGVGVVIHARHMCMEARGVQKVGTSTATSAIRGVFQSQPEVRAEFMQLVVSASKPVSP